MEKQAKTVEKKHFFNGMVRELKWWFAVLRWRLGFKKCLCCAHYAKSHATAGEWGWCFCDAKFKKNAAHRPFKNGNKWTRCPHFDCSVKPYKG